MSITVKTPQRPIFLYELRPSPEAEAELEWLFNRAEIEIGTPSSWHTLVQSLASDRAGLGSTHDAERRADALHNARKIVDWLEAMPRPLADVLVAAYRPTPWPERVELKLGRVTGIVMTLRSVLDCWSRAMPTGVVGIAGWLEGQLARGDEALADAARAEAMGLYVRALRAYYAARGRGPCLIEKDGQVP
jgi:hypothetical protein